MLPPALAILGAFRQFILCALPSKLPVSPYTGQVGINAHDTQHHTDAATAYAAAERMGHAVAFVLTQHDPLFCLDIDGALQPDGTWSALSQSVLAALPGAACEVSQSGRGLHIWGVCADMPAHACKNTSLGIELYHTDRFICLGREDAVGDASLDCSTLLPSVIAQWFPPSATPDAPAEWTDGPCAEWRGPADDEALIARMMACRSNPFGAKATVQDLWTRNVEVLARAYPPSGNGNDPYDGSSADMALASHLAFWTGKDCARIERLMRMSALVREKYDREDYLRLRTIPTAVAGCVNVYVEKAAVVEGVGPVAGTPASAPAVADVAGSTFASIDDQRQLFAGCVYVRSAHKVLIPGGDMLDAQRFNATAPYNRFTYMLDASNERTTRKAFEALTQSQALVWPQARDTCFRPELPVGHITWDGLANTWWPIETPSEPGDITPFLSYLSKALPVERDRAILLNYMAALVQFPGDKFQWWPLIQSTKGNGKTLILEVLENCVGHRYSFRPNAAEIANGGGKFTGWLRGRVLVGFEEIRTAHKGEVLEILKPIVSNDRLEIQNKGVDQDMGDNRANGILLTNYKDAVKIDDDERRYCPLFCAQQSKADLARDGMDGDYFPRLYHWLRHEGGLARLNHYLRTFELERELSPALNNGGKCHRAPESSSMGDAITATLGRVEQEVLEAVAEGKAGFSNGWISSIELDNLLREKRLDGLVPRIKRPDMLRSLGYVHHPGLHGGRTTTPTSGGHRPVLYIREGHIAGQVQGGAAITRAYEAAQLPNVFGVDSKVQVA